jgi:tetratricopeptide (TPR) repeat protein
MKFILFVILLFLSVYVPLVNAQSIESLMEQGDKAYGQFNDHKALKFYENVIRMDSTNCQATWKASRSLANLGEEADKDKQEYYYTRATRYARKAVSLCPDNADAHLALAIAVGRLALFKGGKTKVRMSKEVKEQALETLNLDPEKDIAHHVLGRWHREVASLSGLLKMFAKILYGGLPPASYEKALEHFNKAIELNPDYINHHLELAMTFEKLDQWEMAKREYNKVLNLPATEKNDTKYQNIAQKNLEKVNKKIKD